MLIKIVDFACVQVTGGFLKLPLVALDSKVSALKRSCKRKTTFRSLFFFGRFGRSEGLSFGQLGDARTPTC